jgi:hypothetical protein
LNAIKISTLLMDDLRETENSTIYKRSDIEKLLNIVEMRDNIKK